MEDPTTYRVVVSHEEQYSIWPADREIPPGWRDAGRVGPRQECLSYVQEAWTDLRPLSPRKQMEEDARLRAERPEPEPAPEDSADAATASGRDELVRRLSEGDHPVEAGLRPARTVQLLEECIDRKYVLVTFTGTRGGTELGMRLDEAATDLTRADFDKGTGSTRLVGNLTLNDVQVRCVADIDLQTLSGLGHLEPLE